MFRVKIRSPVLPNESLFAFISFEPALAKQNKICQGVYSEACLYLSYLRSNYLLKTSFLGTN